MTIAEWCLLGAVFLYLGTLAAPKALSPRAFDNAVPRDPEFFADPMRARALGAHNNGIETFPLFAAGVLLAEFRLAPQEWTDGLAVAFLITRALFVWAYVTDRSTARSMLWNIGFGFNLGLFLLAGYGKAEAIIAVLLGFGWAIAVGFMLRSLR